MRTLSKIAARLQLSVNQPSRETFIQNTQPGDVVLHNTPYKTYIGNLVGRERPGLDHFLGRTQQNLHRLQELLGQKGSLALGAGIKLVDFPGVEGLFRRGIWPGSHISQVGLGGESDPRLHESLGRDAIAQRTGGLYSTPFDTWGTTDVLTALRPSNFTADELRRAMETFNAARERGGAQYDVGIFPHLLARLASERLGSETLMRDRDRALAERRVGCDPYTGVCSQQPVTSLASFLSGHSGGRIGENPAEDKRLFEAERHVSERMGLPVPRVLGANPAATPNMYREARRRGFFTNPATYEPHTPTWSDIANAAFTTGTRRIGVDR